MKWEYTIKFSTQTEEYPLYRDETQLLVDEMNEMGNNGWELVQLKGYYCIFKRPLPLVEDQVKVMTKCDSNSGTQNCACGGNCQTW